jgi:hypothetical protein
MDTIIAGVFLNDADAARAAADLAHLPGGAPAVARFYNSPQSHHVPGEPGGVAPPGVESRRAGTHAARGAGAGIAPGIVAGLAAAPVVGPAGPVIGATLGAYVGSLIGAMQGQSAEVEAPAPVRRGGPVVAVVASTRGEEQAVTRVLAAAGAVQIERASGRIVAGDWVDYDPDSTPVLLLDRTPAAD